MRTAAAALLTLLTIVSTTNAAPTLRLFDGSRVTGDVTQVDHTGVELRTGDPENQRTRRIDWTDIRAVTDWAVPEPYLRTHELAVLTVTRERRGDIPAAALAAFELAPRVVGSSTPLSTLVARVLYEDASRRGHPFTAITAATIPGRLTPTRDASEDRYNLPTGAPPIRTNEPHRWSIDPSLVVQTLNERDKLVIEIYAAIDTGSIDNETLEDIRARARQINGDLGIEFLVHTLTAQLDLDPTTRKAAVTRLLSRATSRPGGWIDAWARLAVAQSYLRETDAESVSSALVQLTHVAVRMDETHPKLARLARRMITNTLETQGRDEELAKFHAAFARDTHQGTRSNAQP